MTFRFLMAVVCAAAVASSARAQDASAGTNLFGASVDMKGFGPADANGRVTVGRIPTNAAGSSHEEESASANGVSYKVAWDQNPRGHTSFRVLAPEGLGVRISDNGKILVQDTVPATVDARPGHFLRVELFTPEQVVFDHKFEAKGGRTAQLWVSAGAPTASAQVQMNAAPPAYAPEPTTMTTTVAEPAPASPCLASDDFGSVKDAVSAESFSEQKLSVLQTAMAERRVCVAQVVELLGLFDFGNDKLSALKMLAPKINDRQNDFKVYSAFTFDSEKTEAKKILR